MKIESAWGRGLRGLVRCTARLTRPLRVEEAERITRLLKTSIDGTQVVYECRPEAVEEWHTRLVESLGGPVAAGYIDGHARREPRRGNASPLRRRGQ